MQTAEQISHVLDLPVIVVHGLCECALAVQRDGLFNLQPQFHNPLNINFYCPKMKLTGIDETLEKFEESCLRLVEKYGETGDIVIVTHREGIRELANYAGKPIRRVTYCQTVQLTYTHPDGTWRLENSNDFLSK